jgi:hypothetical protein
MLATVLVVWCVGSFLLAPVVGRAMRGQRSEPLPASVAKCTVEKSLEVA